VFVREDSFNVAPWNCGFSKDLKTITGWWFGTFCFFHIFWRLIPTDELHHFSEGWLNHQPDKYQSNRINKNWEHSPLSWFSHRNKAISTWGFTQPYRKWEFYQPTVTSWWFQICENTSKWWSNVAIENTSKRVLIPVYRWGLPIHGRFYQRIHRILSGSGWVAQPRLVGVLPTEFNQYAIHAIRNSEWTVRNETDNPGWWFGPWLLW